MEVGIDIEEIDRFKKLSAHFVRRVFSEKEREFAEKHKNPEVHLCAFWCIKEAVIKALSNKHIPLSSITTLHEPDGKPYIEKNKMISDALSKQGCSEIKISVSHTKFYCTAICEIY